MTIAPIAVLGSINVDVTAYSDRLPKPGETIHGESYLLGLGGKGANQAAAVAKLGVGLAFFGRTGRDAFGILARQELEKLGVALTHVAEDGAAGTGIAIIAVDAAAQNCITVIAGANFTVGARELAALAALPVAPRVLLLQLEVPIEVNIAAAKRVRAAGGIVILDPAPAPKNGLPPELLQNVDIITPNEVETAALTGAQPRNKTDARDAAMQLRRNGTQRAVIKMGALGAYWSDAHGEGSVPRFEVNAIDTVAAGDCFNGGLAVALAEGKSLGEAVRFASACGALATTRRGAASAAPTRAEVEALLASAR